MQLSFLFQRFWVSCFRASPVLRQITLSSAACVLASVACAGANAQTMAMAGQFAVSPSGAATYSIPIQVPPGAGGMQPQLALSYNSQAGNGLLGVGWNLSGLSAIARCARTMAQDGVRGGVNYDGNDRFCLDGQRLMVISGAYGAAGSEYRTELESFARISYDGAAFKVQNKAGLTSEYGNTPDSKIEAQGKSVVRVWALNKMTDAVGNYLRVAYQEDNANGDFRVDRIDYAGNDNTGQGTTNAVTFGYEGRADVVPLYQAGSVVKMMQRLSTVSTYAAGSLVKTYRSAYEPSFSDFGLQYRSVVRLIQECGVVACMPEVRVTGSQSLTGLNNGGAWLTGAYGNWDGSADRIRVADVNGDGLPDVLIGPDGSGNWYVLKNTGSSLVNEGVWLAGAFGGWDREASRIRLADMNGDGLPDVLIGPDGSGNWYVLKNTGNSFVNTGAWLTGAYGNWDGSANRIRTVELDNDGAIDILVGPDGSGNWYVIKSNPINNRVAEINTQGVTSHFSYTKKLLIGRTVSPSIYPNLNLFQNVGLVDSVSVTNGAGSSNTTAYSFGGLKAEVGTGRGMLGFGWMKAREESTGIESYTEYRQDWPYTGLPSWSETRLAGAGAGGVLKRTQVNYACKTGSGADCQPVPSNCNAASNVATCTGISFERVFPYASSVTEQSWDLNGTAMPVINTYNLYDKSINDALYWGDASQVVVSTTSGASSSTKQVQNEYYPANTSSGKWIAGRLKRASVTSTVTAP